MTLAYLIIWLATVLTTPVYARLNNLTLDYALAAHDSAVIHNIDPKKFTLLIQCESGLNHRAVGDHGNANGLLQFWEGTFNKFSETYNMPNANYKNPLDQIELAARAIQDGKASHWLTCAKKSGLI